ncbi:MAG TPA: sugar ABC transporter permease [Microlunatus sp.]
MSQRVSNVEKRRARSEDHPMRDVLGDRRAVVILLGPALLLYTLIKAIPVFWSFGLSFFEGNPLRGFEFVGFGNFSRFVADPDAHTAIVVTLKYAVVVTIGQVILGYGLALLYVFVLRKSSPFVRTLLFFPTVLPTVAVAMLFKSIFAVGDPAGPVNGILQGLGHGAVDFFASGGTTFLVAVIMDLWRSMGFFAILLFVGLLDIPAETLESARIDGAGSLRLVRHIVLPLSLPILLSVVIFSFNGSLKVFDSLLALNNGGPGSETTPLTLLMFRETFDYNDYGYGSTVALALTILCFLVTIAIFRASRSDVTA